MVKKIIKLAISGATGRMGQELLKALQSPEFRQFEIVGLLTRKGKAPPGFVDDPVKAFAHAQVVIDFAPPSAIIRHTRLAAQVPAAYVCGTSALVEDEIKALQLAARHIPVLWCENFSVGMLTLKNLAARTAATLSEGYDIDIIESHHNAKLDAPSGSAKALLTALTEASQRKHQDTKKHGRRRDLEPGIAISFTRRGGVIGEHSVVFSSPEDELILTHRAISRSLFATGALRAASKLFGNSPGFYNLAQILTDD